MIKENVPCVFDLAYLKDSLFLLNMECAVMNSFKEERERGK